MEEGEKSKEEDKMEKEEEEEDKKMRGKYKEDNSIIKGRGL